MAKYIPPPTPPRPPVHLELTPEEAAYLFGYLQNPLGCTPQEEGSEAARARLGIWNALRDAGCGR